ncbi:MAG: apolipoprotein N-acyltransferase [Paracoccaceae bacterium]
MIEKILHQRGWRLALMALVLGAVLALALQPFNLALVNLVVLPALVALLAPQRGRFWRGFGLGWFVGLGYFAVALHWIVEPFLVDVVRTGWLAPFGIIGMAGGMALFWALAFGLAVRVAKGTARDALALAAIWGAVELARGYVLTGFPWAQLAQGLLDTPLAQWVAYIGAPGLGAMVMLGAGLLAFRSSFLAGLTMLLIMGAVGIMRDAGDTPAEPGVILRLVQPNASQQEKWRPDRIFDFYMRQIEMTGAGMRPDLVIWPEAAIAYLPAEDAQLRAEIAAAGRGSPVILGAVRRDNSGIYNALFAIDAQADIIATYDKLRLAPFGEYMPFNDFFNSIGISGLADIIGGGAQHGTATGPITLEGLPPFLPLICYEAIFPQAASTHPRPAWLLQITNDGWFGTFSGPYQHLAQARLRAIEQGLPLARVANTGVSAMIDARGHIRAETRLGEMAALDARLPGALPPTLYSLTGDWPVALLLCVFAAFFAVRRPRFAA